MKPIVARLVSICFLCSLWLPVSALETRAGVEIKGDTAIASGHFSAGISEILKMMDAKVDLEVIKSYIKNSRIAYNPSASEIIALKDRGVPNEILAAMLQHGADLRAQAPTAAPMPPQMPDYNNGGVPYDYSMAQNFPYATYPTYGDSYAYGGYPYPYSYWYYYNYPYWPYYSSFYFNYPFYFSRFHSYYRYHNFYGHPHAGFHNGFHGGFHGGGPWAAAGVNHFHSFANSGRSFSTFNGGFHGTMGHVGGFSGGSGFRGGGAGGHSGGGGFHGHR